MNLKRVRNWGQKKDSYTRMKEDRKHMMTMTGVILWQQVLYWQATCCRTGQYLQRHKLASIMGKKADKVRRIIAHVYNKQDKQLDDSTFAYTSDSDDSHTHSEVDETRSLVSYSDEECGSESDHADGPTEGTLDTFPILYYTHVQEGYLKESFRRTSHTEHSVSVSY